MSTVEGFSILKNWYEQKTIIEVLSLSFSGTDWPFRIKARVSSCTPESSTITLTESDPEETTRSLKLASAEIKWARPEDNAPPFEGASSAEFKGFLFIKLTDGNYLVMVERQPAHVG